MQPSGKELWKLAGMQEQCILSPRGPRRHHLRGLGASATIAIRLDAGKPSVLWKSSRGALCSVGVMLRAHYSR